MMSRLSHCSVAHSIKVSQLLLDIFCYQHYFTQLYNNETLRTHWVICQTSAEIGSSLQEHMQALAAYHHDLKRAVRYVVAGVHTGVGRSDDRHEVALIPIVQPGVPLLHTHGILMVY